ncbi:hypothetical protein G6F57_019857 [Rhizopus arrhizus]|nr:hypothetical protein G6F22_017206 [Rhizopus arrhizus]KAG1176219.1 hypothetical protein G6F35_016496 [Rhizopus arrhizus]KAG1438435.1 hypothetical protein G6F57_019857 [Rhizopus arrhizus]
MDTTPNLGAQVAGALRQDGFKRLHVDGPARAGRAGQAVRPRRRVDVVVKELDAREMAGRLAWLAGPMGGGRNLVGALIRVLRRGQRVQQAAAVQGF